VAGPVIHHVVLTTKKPRRCGFTIDQIGGMLRGDGHRRDAAATSVRYHLNCGICGTVMRGGGSGATAGALLFLAIWPNISAAPSIAPLDASAAEPPCAKAAVDNETTTKAKAIFTVVFNMNTPFKFTGVPRGLM